MGYIRYEIAIHDELSDLLNRKVLSLIASKLFAAEPLCMYSQPEAGNKKK